MRFDSEMPSSILDETDATDAERAERKLDASADEPKADATAPTKSPGGRVAEPRSLTQARRPIFRAAWSIRTAIPLSLQTF